MIYVALDQDGRLWFTEVLSNKIGYLDTNIPVPIHAKISEDSIKIDSSATKYLDLWIEYNDTPSTILTDDLQISLTGMTHSGINGISYDIMPKDPGTSNDKTHTVIRLSPQDSLKPGLYNIMLQVTAKEEADKDLKVSVLRHLEILVDIPKTNVVQDSKQTNESDAFSEITLKDIIQTVALSVAIGLSALIILRRIKLRISKNKPE